LFAPYRSKVAVTDLVSGRKGVRGKQ
jgi:hypothetical protein